MTSNFADRLDDALIRPGRIDKQIFLGHISPRTAELVFMGKFGSEHTDAAPNANLERGDNMMRKLALSFSRQIPEDAFTPAQIQGYLLCYRNSPVAAAAGIVKWIEEEKAKLQEAETLADKASAQKNNTVKLKEKTKEDSDDKKESPPNDPKKEDLPTYEKKESLSDDKKREELLSNQDKKSLPNLLLHTIRQTGNPEQDPGRRLYSTLLH